MYYKCIKNIQNNELLMDLQILVGVYICMRMITK